MPRIERIEIEARRGEIARDVSGLIEKWRAIAVVGNRLPGQRTA